MDIALRNQQASIHNLANQIGQISKMLAERQLGMLPSTIESNPREHIKVVTLKSGKQLASSLPMANDDVVVQDEPARKEPEPKLIEPAQTKDKTKSPVREYQPPIPYPIGLKQKKVDQQFGKFLDLFKQLRINLPFVEAILQMSRYARFLKEILSNKRKLEDLGLVTLNEECSSILQNKMPIKWRDPRSFTVPCIIRDLHISDALVDLGASINLMPTSLFEKLGLSRPFLATSRAVINVCDDKLQLRVDDETITFDLSTFMRHSLDHDDNVYSVDVLDDIVGSQLQEILLNDPLQVALQTEDE
ncbi:uncharacterized protein LOC125369519 [Ricinus communis]|uniref:uncharacterized protein LOC125369519 n=1 Tax=Ricinus communis TaxID=3988 RepID=UPI00201A5AA5|nr:uncharacterized protein LOC125369519 [Ricinus communis]